MSGFGIITLCSIWPIVLVLGAALGATWTGAYLTPGEYVAAQLGGSEAGSAAGRVSPLVMIGESLRSAAISVPGAVRWCSHSPFSRVTGLPWPNRR